jgi:hypothetical protein
MLRDRLATVATFAVALSWLKLMDGLADREVMAQTLSRKLIHIGTGPLFVLCWPLFSDSFYARFLAALVPLALTGKLTAIVAIAATLIEALPFKDIDNLTLTAVAIALGQGIFAGSIG